VVPQTLEERVARLEQQMTRLAGGQPDESLPGADDWKQTVGMFRGDPIVEEMLQEARRIREEDRRQAREAQEPGPA
jgi:hypothetical protein